MLKPKTNFTGMLNGDGLHQIFQADAVGAEGTLPTKLWSNSAERLLQQFLKATMLLEGFHGLMRITQPWTSHALCLLLGKRPAQLGDDLQIPKIQSGVSIWRVKRQVKHLYKIFCICLTTENWNLGFLLGTPIKKIKLVSLGACY